MWCIPVSYTHLDVYKRQRQYRLPTRESKIQKVGGLYGLYLYYCYRLGYLPKHNQKQQNTARLHYLLKDDLMKMDELTKQVTLLGKHQIGTDAVSYTHLDVYKRQIFRCRSCAF